MGQAASGRICSSMMDPAEPVVSNYALLLCGSFPVELKGESEWSDFTSVAKAAFHEPKRESWDIYEVYDGEMVQTEDIDKFEAFIITHSATATMDMSVHWVSRLRELIVTLHQRKKRVVGFGFGAQIIAVALGGKTQPCADGWNISCPELSVTEAGLHVFGKDKLNAFHFIQNEIVELPPNAVALAKCDSKIEIFQCPEQNPYIFGIQCEAMSKKEWATQVVAWFRLQEKLSYVASTALTAAIVKNNADTQLLEKVCLKLIKAYEQSALI